jgi:hypothetical protein
MRNLFRILVRKSEGEKSPFVRSRLKSTSILKTWGIRVWTGIMWLRTGKSIRLVNMVMNI